MGITLGGFEFGGPCPVDQWVASHEGGIYVMLCGTDAPDGTPVYTPSISVARQTWSRMIYRSGTRSLPVG